MHFYLTNTSPQRLNDEICVPKPLFSAFVNETVPEKGFIYKTFKNLYYTDEENCWLDGFAKKVASSNLTHREGSLYMYTLFQACLKKRPFNLFHRINLNLRLNVKVKRSFGNFRTWERPFAELMLQSYDDLAASVWKGRGTIRILQPSTVNAIKAGYDLVYLDPPYISMNEKNNWDDYWRKYHFLEGLSRYDEWGAVLERNSQLKSIPAPKSFYDWSQKNTFTDKLDAIVKKHRQSIVVLSYLSDSYPDERTIRILFESLFSQVSMHSKTHIHALSKNRKRELLFIGRP